MVDVSAKPDSERRAVARGTVRMDQATFDAVVAGDSKKGDLMRIAELAGTMAAKRTAELIPLCHPLPLTAVRVAVDPDPVLPGLTVIAEVRTTGRTGVEMEALTAVSVACLTIYDMLKARARDMTIEAIGLVSKSGGASGDWQRKT
ncbi:MAG: cyclic pyranopterin monophosphate synthase MoaC [Sphingomicrobium sp.]